MVLPVIMLFWILFGGLAAAKTAFMLVMGGTVLVDRTVANRSLRNFRLGINPVYQKARFAEEMENEKIAKGSGDFSYLLYPERTVDKKDVPPDVAETLAGKWRLNDDEFIQLHKSFQTHQITDESGKAWESVKGLLEKVDEKQRVELMNLIYSGPIAYHYLSYVSRNRRADKEFVRNSDAMIALAKG